MVGAPRPVVVRRHRPARPPVSPSSSSSSPRCPTIEFFDTIAEQLKERKGILEVSGSERTITVTWDTTLSETDVRRILAEVGNPVQP